MIFNQVYVLKGTKTAKNSVDARELFAHVENDDVQSMRETLRRWNVYHPEFSVFDKTMYIKEAWELSNSLGRRRISEEMSDVVNNSRQGHLADIVFYTDFTL
jgi:hypothetical protein